jgi:ligand-binding SRPBCC domain-containing protein
MQTLDRDEVSAHVDAPPEAVYAVVADVTQTPRLSPEIVQCVWLDGASGPAVGARFKATNKVARGPAWSNTPVVTVAEPGREFAFERTEKFSGTIAWRYRFEPEESGTRVTESYEVVRPVSALGWFIIERFFGGHDRRAELRAGMQRTLERLQEVVADAQAPGSTG